MSWLSNLGGSIFSSILGSNSAKKAAAQQFEYAKALQQQNIDWEKEQYQNKNQWTVADMKAAGLNPILAAGNTGSVSSAPGGSVSIADSKLDVASAYAQLRHTEAESESLKEGAIIGHRNAEANHINAIANANSSSALKNKYDFDIFAGRTRLGFEKMKLENDILNANRSTEAQIRYLGALGDAASLNAATNQLLANSNSSLNIQRGKWYDSQTDYTGHRKVVEAPARKYGESVIEGYRRNGEMFTILDAINNAARRWF